MTDYARTLGGRVDPRDVVLWAAVVGVELLLVLGYVAMTPTSITQPRYAIYPFVWINVGVLAVSQTTIPSRGWRVSAISLAITSVYLALLLSLGGLLRVGVPQPLPVGTGVGISAALPGWGPIVTASSPLVQVIVIPFKLVGYLAFSYLLYARLLDATKGVLSGLFGLVSCVGCTFSILTPLLGASAFGAVTSLSWDLSTLVYILTIALLYWGTEVSVILSSTARSITRSS